MITNIEEAPATAQTPAASEQPKAGKKATGAKRARNVAPAKTKSGKKVTSTKKAPRARRKAQRPLRAPKAAKEKGAARQGSKTEAILDLLKQPGGATAKELLKVTGWQPHSLRGFISSTLGKKMGLTVKSTKGEDGERSYSIKA